MIRRTLPALLFLTGAVFVAYSRYKLSPPAPAIAVQPVTVLAPDTAMPVKVSVKVPALPPYMLIDMNAPHAPSLLNQKRVGWRQGLTPDINARGQSIGSEQTGEHEESYVNGEGETVRMPETRKVVHAFAYYKGAKQDLDTSGSDRSDAHCINDRGQIVGVANGYPILWMGDRMITLPTPHEFGGEANWINNQGDIAGYTDDSACVWRQGKIYLFAEVAGTGSKATCISDSGDVVGDAKTYSENRREWVSQPFYYHQGKLQRLTTLPDCMESYANSVNNRGDVVGRAERRVMIVSHPAPGIMGNRFPMESGLNYENQRRAVLWRNSVCIDLNTVVPAGSGWELLDATALNDQGYIIGEGRFHGKQHTFLLKPNSRNFAVTDQR